jgi:hypothetical protein
VPSESSTPNPLNMTRGEKWHYIIDTLLGGLDDGGIVKWLVTQGVQGDGMDLDRLFAEAVKLRGGQVAT